MLLLRPRDLGPAPLPVEARAYFSQDQLEKAEAFRTGQLWLYGAQLADRGRRADPARAAPARAAAARGAAPAGAGRRGRRGRALSVAVGLAPLPVSAIAQERARDVGLVTQGWRGWAGDVAKSQAIGARLRRGRRRAADRRHAPLRPPLVDPGRGRGGRVRRGHHLRRARRPRPALQHVQAAAGRPDALRRPRARQARRGRRRPGLRGRRLAPHERRQRLRERARPHQARGALRQPAEATSPPPRCGSSSPTSSATCATATCRAGCSTC